MINYIWIGFIILAIGFGAYREITQPPPMESPEIIVESFEQNGEGVTLSKDEYYYKGEYHRDSRQSARIDYRLGENDKAVVPINIEIPGKYTYTQPRAEKAEEYDVTGLIVYANAEASSTTLSLNFIDANGNRFAAAKELVLLESGLWKKYVVKLSELKALGDNTESPAFPLRVEEAVVGRVAGGSASNSLYIDQISLELPKIVAKDVKYESRTWMGVLTHSTTSWVKSAIELAIGLIGVMMLWLGMMRIAEKAGLVEIIARMVKPIMVFLFPAIPANGEAMGAIVMNVAANMLGLGNAATPLGIKAMKELQALNPSDEWATDAQCMLLAINTSSVTVIPITIIGYRAASGSTDLMAFWLPMLLATLFSTICAVASCKLLEKLPMFRIPAAALQKHTTKPAGEEQQ